MHSPDIILASASETRKALLTNAGVEFRSVKPLLDEDAIKQSAVSEGISPRDIADMLGEAKAQKVAMKNPSSFVIGCDQTLSIEGAMLSKPTDKADLFAQLNMLRGNDHTLFSSAVIFENAKPVWRHVSTSHLKMHDLNDQELQAYVDENWEQARHSVGGYQIEGPSIRLFSKISGDYFSILGLPLIELLNYLRIREFV